MYSGPGSSNLGRRRLRGAGQFGQQLAPICCIIAAQRFSTMRWPMPRFAALLPPVA